MNLHVRVAIFAIFLPAPVLVSGQNIAKDVVWEKGAVLVKPCDLRFSIPEKWEPAPKGVSNIPDNKGFMFGRRSVKDKQGHEIIPTLAMFWQRIDYVEMDAKKGQDVDPLFVYTMSNRPDIHSRDFNLEKNFLLARWPADFTLCIRLAI